MTEVYHRMLVTAEAVGGLELVHSELWKDFSRREIE